jgi:hypothetical protein
MLIVVTSRTNLAAPVTPPTGPAPPLDDPTYSILVLFEELPSMEPIVTASMEVRRLRQLVAAWAGVPPDTVYLQFAGTVLDVDRQLSDAPAIRSGAHVHAFFSIARAIQFVLHLMQGGNPPPPATPLPAQVFGPVLPPGYARGQSPLSQPQSPSLPPAHQQSTSKGPGMGTRTTASERLRSTFKCPKFLGEARHWKLWNQGFVRFLSINQLDHVIEEDFLRASLTPELQEENKLVYYILEETGIRHPSMYAALQYGMATRHTICYMVVLPSLDRQLLPFFLSSLATFVLRQMKPPPMLSYDSRSFSMTWSLFRVLPPCYSMTRRRSTTCCLLCGLSAPWHLCTLKSRPHRFGAASRLRRLVWTCNSGMRPSVLMTFYTLHTYQPRFVAWWQIP